jgi:ERCC4-related helicase
VRWTRLTRLLPRHHLDESPSDVWLEPAANSDGGRLLVPSSISRYLFGYQKEGEERGKCCHRPVNLPLDRCFFASEAHNGAGPCEKCPGCYTFAVMNKLTKVCNHPALLQLDAKDEAKVEKCEAARRFARLAYGDASKFEGKALFRSQGLLDLHRSVNDCGKMQTLKALLESFDRERDAKVLVFSLSTQVLDVLEAFVRTQYTYLRLDGGTPVKERQKLVDQFNDPRGDVFVALISTRAGGTGLNLQAANKVVVFDVNWNPTLDAQAQDRAYRLGQKRQVDIFRLVSKGTIEEMTFMRSSIKKRSRAPRSRRAARRRTSTTRPSSRRCRTSTTASSSGSRIC